ncbi:MAG TPA: response regulator transcription factor [Bacteroidales bacterium]|nr:response regulator transcription factor [Bacteroidales bacterium]
MKEIYKVFIVDDHKIFREGLVFMISKMKGFEVVGEASNGKAFLDIVDELDVDIVIMDIAMPGIDGIAATTRVLEKHPEIKVIALTMFSDEEYYYKMIQAGVAGYILKESGKEELATALNTVITGENYFSQKILHNIIVNMNNVKTFKKSSADEIKLTRRENEILTLICQGLSNQEISDKLCLSLRTIEGHKSNLLSKTGVKNSISLVMYAMKHHLVEI